MFTFEDILKLIINLRNDIKLVSLLKDYDDTAFLEWAKENIKNNSTLENEVKATIKHKELIDLGFTCTFSEGNDKRGYLDYDYNIKGNKINIFRAVDEFVFVITTHSRSEKDDEEGNTWTPNVISEIERLTKN